MAMQNDHNMSAMREEGFFDVFLMNVGHLNLFWMKFLNQELLICDYTVTMMIHDHYIMRFTSSNPKKCWQRRTPRLDTDWLCIDAKPRQGASWPVGCPIAELLVADSFSLNGSARRANAWCTSGGSGMWGTICVHAFSQKSENFDGIHIICVSSQRFYTSSCHSLCICPAKSRRRVSQTN